MDSRIDRLEQDAARQEAAAGREWWIKWVVATTAVLSALAAFGSVRSQGFANEALFHSNQAVLFQAQASDAWTEFQANSLSATSTITPPPNSGRSPGPPARNRRPPWTRPSSRSTGRRRTRPGPRPRN
jgi:hypothetical protein